MDEPLIAAPALSAAIRTPRAAGVAGIVFSVIFASAIILVRDAIDLNDAGSWLTSDLKRQQVILCPSVAGIAFLWFIGVMRDRVGASAIILVRDAIPT
jgi:hypothetical protein